MSYTHRSSSENRYKISIFVKKTVKLRRMTCYTHIGKKRNNTDDLTLVVFIVKKLIRFPWSHTSNARTEVSLNKKYLFTVIRVELLPQIATVIGALFCSYVFVLWLGKILFLGPFTSYVFLKLKSQYQSFCIEFSNSALRRALYIFCVCFREV